LEVLMTGLEVFDSTIHKTHQWLNDIATELAWGDRHTAYIALRAALHALRDRLTVEEAVHLGAQLPMLIRGLYYEGWKPSRKPIKWHKPEFLACIRDGFRGREEPDPEAVARAVFTVLARHVSAGEIKDVKHILPKRLRELWPEVRVGTRPGGERKTRKPL
jgi:uncharacterized protein (DUF2267 family)